MRFLSIPILFLLSFLFSPNLCLPFRSSSDYVLQLSHNLKHDIFNASNSLYPRGLASKTGLYPSPYQSLTLAPGWLTLFTTYSAFRPLGPAGLALGSLYWEVFTAALGQIFASTPVADPIGDWSAQLGALLLKFENPDGGSIPWSVIAMWAYRAGLHNGRGFTASYKVEFYGPNGGKLYVSLT